MNPTKGLPTTVAELAKSSDVLRRIFRYGIMFPILIAALAGCGKTEPSPSPPAIAPVPIESWPASRATDGGNFTVTLRPAEASIERGRHFSLEVLLEPGADASSPTSLLVDADMPAHRHGMNTQPEIIELGENHYRADGMLFHMAGDWVIVVEITTADGTEHATFPVHVE